MYMYIVLLHDNNNISKIPDDGYLVTCRTVSSHERSVGWLTKLEQENSLSPAILRTQLTELVEHCTDITGITGSNSIPSSETQGQLVGAGKSIKRARKEFGRKKVKIARRAFKPDFYFTLIFVSTLAAYITAVISRVFKKLKSSSVEGQESLPGAHLIY